MSSSVSATDASEFVSKASRKDWIAVAAMVMGAFIAILDIQIINSSLADIQGALSATMSEGSWISTSYMIAEIVMIPLSAWIASIVSLKRYLLWSVSGFIITSALCGMAWSLESMILFRTLQGISVAPLIPLSFSLIRMRLPQSQQAMGMSLFSFAAVFAPAIGPSLGGWLTNSFSWHLIFYINLLPGLVMLAMLRYALDDEPMRLDLLKQADWAGIATLSIGLASLEFVLEEGNRNNWFESHEIVFMAAAATISLISFVWLQLTRENPLLNLRILKDRQFFLGNLANCAIGLGMFGSVFLLPMYLSRIQSYNALQIGEVMLWGGLPQLLLIPMIPKLMKVVEKHWLCLFGLLMFAISVYQNAFMTADYSGDQFRFSLILRAIGQPFIMVTLSVIATEKLALKDIHSASSLYNTSRNLSGAIGIAILSTMVDRRSTLHQVRISEGVSLFDANTQEYLTQLGKALPSLSQQQDLALIMKTVTREATIMAFSDAFLVVAASLFMGFLAVVLIRPEKS